MKKVQAIAVLAVALASASCDLEEIQVGKKQIINETSGRVYVQLDDKEVELPVGGRHIITIKGRNNPCSWDEDYEYGYGEYIDSICIYADREKKQCLFKERREDMYDKLFAGERVQFHTNRGSWTVEREYISAGRGYQMNYITYTFHITDELIGRE